jgi:hypothetical protein
MVRCLFLLCLVLFGVSQASLIGLSTQTDALYEIDPETGVATYLHQAGGNFAGVGLAFLGDQLYATDHLVHIGEPWDVRLAEIGLELTTIADVNNQAGSLNWHGLAGNASSQVLYAIDINQNNVLVEVVIDGSVRMIGSGTGIDGRGMEYDNVNGILYATDMNTSSLYSVDILTGTSTLIGPMGIDAELIGLAYDGSMGILYANTTLGASRGGNVSSLFRIDTQTGSATLIGSNIAERIDGLAWKPDAPSVPEPESYLLFGAGLVVMYLILRPKSKGGLVVGVGLMMGSVHASEISAPLYRSQDPEISFAMSEGQTWILFIKAQNDIALKGIDISGTVSCYVQNSSDFRWQVFQTTPDWQTPGGNADRLFYTQEFFDYQEDGTYSTPMDVQLAAGAYYRLSFQISNVGWTQPYGYDLDRTDLFITGDDMISVFGFSNVAIGPITSRMPLVTLRIDQQTPTVPEPNGLIFFGLGFGLILVTQWIRRKGFIPSNADVPGRYCQKD